MRRDSVLGLAGQRQRLSAPQARSMGVSVNNRLVSTFANQAARLGMRPEYAALGRQSRTRRIFPEQHD